MRAAVLKGARLWNHCIEGWVRPLGAAIGSAATRAGSDIPTCTAEIQYDGSGGKPVVRGVYRAIRRYVFWLGWKTAIVKDTCIPSELQ
jgi:hypothetical protein